MVGLRLEGSLVLSNAGQFFIYSSLIHHIGSKQL